MEHPPRMEPDLGHHFEEEWRYMLSYPMDREIGDLKALRQLRRADPVSSGLENGGS